jgi:hypothetical protein
LVDRHNPDILEKALIKAFANKRAGLITAPEYWILISKVKALKKFRFTREYELLQDK